MNRNIKIFIATLIIFIFLGAGIFSYYSVIERREVVNKFVEKSIEWNDFVDKEPLNKIKVYNSDTKSYDEYLLEDVNYNEVKTIAKDIIKELKQQSISQLDRTNFPEKLGYDQNTILTLNNVVIEPIYIKEKEWHEKLETQVRVYTDIANADLFNIPKEIIDKNETWQLLTDEVSFESLDNNRFNCIVMYSKVNRIEEEKTIKEKYNIKAIYTGKKFIKTGNVKLKYKLTNQNIKMEILPQFSIKLLFISIVTVISIIIFFILYEKLLTKKS